MASNTKTTKLEMEDIILRDEKCIRKAIASLLKDSSNDRVWQSIKFVDTICVNEDSQHEDTACQLRAYKIKQQQLLRRIERSSIKSASLPIIFQVKLDISKGTSIEVLLGLFEYLESAPLAQVRFGKALYGFNNCNVPEILSGLCVKLTLQEAITMEVVYEAAGEDAGPLSVIRQCKHGLRLLCHVITLAVMDLAANLTPVSEGSMDDSCKTIDNSDLCGNGSPKGVRSVKRRNRGFSTKSLSSDQGSMLSDTSCKTVDTGNVSRDHARASKGTRHRHRSSRRDVKRSPAMKSSELPDYDWARKTERLQPDHRWSKLSPASVQLRTASRRG